MLVLNGIESEASNKFLELLKANERNLINGLIVLKTAEIKKESAPLADWLVGQNYKCLIFQVLLSRRV